MKSRRAKFIFSAIVAVLAIAAVFVYAARRQAAGMIYITPPNDPSYRDGSGTIAALDGNGGLWYVCGVHPVLHHWPSGEKYSLPPLDPVAVDADGEVGGSYIGRAAVWKRGRIAVLATGFSSAYALSRSGILIQHFTLRSPDNSYYEKTSRGTYRIPAGYRPWQINALGNILSVDNRLAVCMLSSAHHPPGSWHVLKPTGFPSGDQHWSVFNNNGDVCTTMLGGHIPRTYRLELGHFGSPRTAELPAARASIEAMNDMGVMVGEISDPTGPGMLERPVALSTESVTYLSPHGITGTATDIDDHGNVIGFYDDPGLVGRYPVLAHWLQKLPVTIPIQIEFAQRLVMWRHVP